VVLWAYMEPREVLSALEVLARKLGVPVRFETFDPALGRGGLCKLRGRPVIVIDAGLPLLDRIGVLAQALGAFDLEAIYVPPVLRARIERHAKARKEDEGRPRTPSGWQRPLRKTRRAARPA
jgi:hypothetical protein